MANDYLGAIFRKPKDKVDYGVLGMKWGIRRDRATLRKEAAKRSSSSTQPTKGPDGQETSASRYARLSAQAKAGKASEMTEQDLKFFNARTEALSKVNKLYENESSWLAKTTKTVLQRSAQRQMQMLSDTLADKYIGKPIADALKTKPVIPKDDES